MNTVFFWENLYLKTMTVTKEKARLTNESSGFAHRVVVEVVS